MTLSFDDIFFFSSRRRHTRWNCDWSSDVCSSDLPLARVLAAASAGVDPSCMGLGPIPASRKALARAGLRISDLDCVELNEAFASQVLACIHDLELDPERVNPNGGAIALGHALGASGARLIATLVHELVRRKARYGLATMCIGVGQGISTVVENLQR